MTLRVLAPAKVNLCLYLGPVRGDGRHQLLTLFQSLSLADTLTLELGEQGDDDVVICPGVDGVNLAQTGLAQLRARGWDGPPLRIEIDKRIPVAGGMAGGSADAAAALRLAVAVHGADAKRVAQEVDPGAAGLAAQEVDPDLVGPVAAQLGADVPSQLVAGLSLGTGAGEVVQRLAPVADHAYVVIPSPQQLSTADVYREADRLGLGRSSEELETLSARLSAALAPGVRLAGEFIVNDLQDAALSLCPSIADALAAALSAGADQAIVSGSGPTVVGIWWGKDAGVRAAVAAAILAGEHPGTLAALPVGPQFGAVKEL